MTPLNTDFILAKCKTKAAFSAKLKHPRKLNLPKIKQHFETILETPVLLIIREEGVEVIVHGYGELLFKNCADTELMERIAGKIYHVGAL